MLPDIHFFEVTARGLASVRETLEWVAHSFRDLNNAIRRSLEITMRAFKAIAPPPAAPRPWRFGDGRQHWPAACRMHARRPHVRDDWCRRPGLACRQRSGRR